MTLNGRRGFLALALPEPRAALASHGAIYGLIAGFDSRVELVPSGAVGLA